MKKRSVLLKLFFSTLYLSAFTFGGGYVVVTLMKKQFVDKYHWIEESEMLDLIAIAQSAPGVAAFNFVDTLAQVGTTVAQVDEILNAEEQVHSETPVTFSDHTVVLKDVRFGYHADQEILHGVSLTIPQNKMTALVGPSGGGKSTIAKLAAGFWDAGSGSITMGGHELKDIPLTQLYDQVAFVSQDNYLFDDTVRENIRMGRRAPPTPRRRRPCSAGCGSFIRSLENGFDTLVGGSGLHLSGGELQRIAILSGGRIVQKGTHAELAAQDSIYRDFITERQQAAVWKL